MDGEKVLKQEQEAGPLSKKSKSNQKESAKVAEEVNVAVAAVLLKEGRAATLTDNDESPDRFIHPLLIRHILDKIFKLIIDPIREQGRHRPDKRAISRDVQNLRLVCKTWKHVATNVFRRARSTMGIGDTSIMEGTDLELSKFLEAMRGSTMIPYQSYRISRSVLTPENRHLMQLFWQLCGPEMVELQLHIHQSDLNSMLEVQGDISRLKLEKLTTLYIRTSHFNSIPVSRKQDCHADVAQFIGFLLTRSEKLKDFKMTYNGFFAIPSGIRKFFVQLPSTLTSVKLELDTPFLDFYLNTLRVKGLKLQAFDLHFHDFRCDWNGLKEAICGFFEGQSETLQKLVVPTVFLTKSKEPFIFPHLHFLKLEMRQMPILFPDRFPKLEVLDLSSVWSEINCMELLSETTPFQSVTELHLSPIILGAGTASKLAKCFPSVRKLYLAPDNNFGEINPLRNLFVYFSGIEELEVSMGNFQSRWFARGEPFLCCVRNPESIIAQLNGNLEEFNPKELHETPSILLLTKLKKLVIKNCGEIKFTDFEAHFLFLKMESLEELYVDSGFEHMSADYVGRLKKKLKIVTDRIPSAH